MGSTARCVNSPQTASQLAALASQLQVALADVQTDSGLNTRPPTAVAPETSAERKQTAALHGGIQEEASFGQPTSEPTQLPLLQSGGGTIILPHKILRWPISIKNLLLRTARMVAIAALLGVLLHRLLLLPGGLALNRFRSTYSSAQVVSEIQNRIRADRRLQMTRVQVRASNGIITLSGDVGSSAERVAAVQNATQIKGIRVIVDNLRVMDSNRQSPNAALGASVVRTATRSKAPRARAFHVAVPADSLRPPSLSETIGVSSSGRTAGVGASASFPATPVRAPEQVTLPYDTVLAVRMKESLSSDLNHRGDTFLATLASPVMVDDRVVIPAEAAIQGKIVDVRNAGRFNGRSALVITLTSLGYNGRSYELRSSQYSKQSVSRNTHTGRRSEEVQAWALLSALSLAAKGEPPLEP